MLAGRIRGLGALTAAVLVAGGCFASRCAAAPTGEQTEKFRSAEAALNRSESLYKNGKLTEAAAAFSQAQKSLAD
ncbi:MAG TPA: hypothetical protein VGY55_13320, partial [Pirellulales bacterium]|nr:hypothetical protein [Pirellulales bacterium]